MKRFGGLFPEVASFTSIVAAARRAARGKRDSAEVAGFMRNLEPEALRIEREILAKAYRPGPYDTFVISDPKRRQITVAPFRDRVIHHTICDTMEPYLERIFIPDSYACRRGKGTLRAVKRAQHFSRRVSRGISGCSGGRSGGRSGYFLKLDVRSFFHSIHHDVLLALLARRFKDRPLLALLEVVVRHPVPNCVPGRGMPIGNLTSQHLANFYLNALDHFVVGTLRPAGYVRYMDDLVLFGHEKAALWSCRGRVAEFLGDSLRLDLKEAATLLAPVTQGLPFLGRRIYPHLVRIRRENLRRSLQRWRRRRRRSGLALEFGRDGDWEGALPEDFEVLERSARAIFAHLAQADSLRLRQGIVAIHGDEDGQAPGPGGNRVKRGGNWNNNAHNCRSANRNNNNPNNSNNNIGFRPANSWHRREACVHGRRPGAQGHDQARCPAPAPAGRRGSGRDGW